MTRIEDLARDALSHVCGFLGDPVSKASFAATAKAFRAAVDGDPAAKIREHTKYWKKITFVRMEKLLELKISMHNRKKKRYETPRNVERLLFEAVRWSHAEIFAFLSRFADDLNVWDRHEMSLLHYAAIGGCAEICEAILDRGGDVDIRRKKSFAPLYYAIRYANRDACELLLSRGAKIAEGDLPTAARYAPHVARMLLERGAEVDSKTIYQETALHCAARRCDSALCKLLLDEGANANARNAYSETPIMFARSAAVCRILVEAGADANARDRRGETALMNCESEAVTELLIDAGAELELESDAGDTALMCAILNDNFEVGVALMRRGARVDVDGCLRSAVRFGRPNFAKLFLSMGGDARQENEDGESLLMIAEQEMVEAYFVKHRKAYMRIVRLLIKHGAE